MEYTNNEINHAINCNGLSFMRNIILNDPREIEILMGSLGGQRAVLDYHIKNLRHLAFGNMMIQIKKFLKGLIGKK